ncbi:helix-turn-helix transcriptional regulator [Nocardioides sp. BGMRC 2183]|nr:helix-turn-helix transcriptional regulator [Nocardioides sp. BGMRC 2183]
MPATADDSWTSRELALLVALSQGESATHIATREQVSPRRVRREVRALRMRLSARTTIHAVAIAVRRHLI